MKGEKSHFVSRFQKIYNFSEFFSIPLLTNGERGDIIQKSQNGSESPAAKARADEMKCIER